MDDCPNDFDRTTLLINVIRRIRHDYSDINHDANKIYWRRSLIDYCWKIFEMPLKSVKRGIVALIEGKKKELENAELFVVT